MAKVAGITRLNRAISKELKPFGISRAKASSEYAYYFNSGKVTYKITEDTLEDNLFKQFVLETFNYEIPNIFIFSLLHEVGHHKTWEDLSDETCDYCDNEKMRIMKEMENAHTRYAIKDLEYQYFKLPDEMCATMWAVSYSMAHPRKIKRMWKKSEKALHKFYKKNGVV